MKKFMIVLLLILFTYFVLNAGEITSTGLKIGYNCSIFTGSDIPGKSVSTIPGFAVGGFISYCINEKFYIQPEILLTTKGSMINTIGDIEQANVFIYLEMPLLTKMKFLPNVKMRPNVFAGPALSLKTLAINDVGVLDDINGFDCGFIIGAGVDYGRISFELRYERGFLNFDKSADDIDLKNQTISILFGIAFYSAGGK